MPPVAAIPEVPLTYKFNNHSIEETKCILVTAISNYNLTPVNHNNTRQRFHDYLAHTYALYNITKPPTSPEIGVADDQTACLPRDAQMQYLCDLIGLTFSD